MSDSPPAVCAKIDVPRTLANIEDVINAAIGIRETLDESYTIEDLEPSTDLLVHLARSALTIKE